MISARKVRANRANARASTGPRTATGKARAARNARQHGLTLSVLGDPAHAAELAVLAREIAGESASSELQELASRIAAAQIDLVRLRQARHHLLSRALGDPNYDSPVAAEKKTILRVHMAKILGPDAPIPPQLRCLFAKPEGPDKFATILADVAGRLAIINRYERRALSRRKFAIRKFDMARTRAK